MSDTVKELSHGGTLPAGGAFSIAVRKDVAVTHVAARRDMAAALRDRAKETLKAELPSSPRLADIDGGMIVWAGPDQWLVIQTETGGNDPATELSMLFKGLASVADVSDSRVIYRVAGATARDALSKGISIDFHDRVFKPGDVAITQIAHVGVTVWRLTNGDTYDISCPRTFSGNVLDWLRNAATIRGAVH